jgi:hypothetical protein
MRVPDSVPDLERGDVQGSKTSTPSHVPAATIVMCVTVVAEYVQGQQKIHVAVQV